MAAMDPRAADPSPVAGSEGSKARRMHSKEKHEMTQPRVACSAPYRLHVLHRTETGEVPSCECGRQHIVFGDKYRYCTCGLSKSQPWCDDSHVGTAFKPLEVTCDRAQSYYLVCGCKRTERPPFCDGSHIHLDWAALEW